MYTFVAAPLIFAFGMVTCKMLTLIYNFFKYTRNDNRFRHTGDEEVHISQSDDDSDKDEDADESDEEVDDYKLENDIPKNLCERMQYYESRTMDTFAIIPPYLPFIIRLDGRGFSKLLRKLKYYAWTNHQSVYSSEFNNAMIRTAEDLITTFSASTAYTHSDEITLIFPPACTYDEFIQKQNKSVHIFKGKITKLLSIIASHTSVRFNKHFRDAMTENNMTEMITEYNKDKYCFTFDARPLVFPTEVTYEIVNHMIWRSKYDCYRNYISMYSDKYLGKTTTEGISTNKRIEMLKEMGVDFDNEKDKSMRNGVYVKLEKYEKSDRESSLDDKKVIRKQTKLFVLPDIKCDDETIRMMLNKNL
uniref:tRNAHis guanylyltransferase catalytic domain-containing protein n=1 Tax=viral metagenome TaxID=1070528 RepID=A0A6C0EBU0_9ZZZZ